MAIIEAEPYAFDLDPARASLVIIDMQRDFLEPGGFGAALGNDVSLLRRTIAPTSRLLERARAAALTIIHTREGHRPDLADLPPTKRARGRLAVGIGDPGPMGRILVRGEPGHDIIPELYPLPSEPVVDKPGKGAFHATDLDAIQTAHQRRLGVRKDRSLRRHPRSLKLLPDNIAPGWQGLALAPSGGPVTRRGYHCRGQPGLAHGKPAVDPGLRTTRGRS